MTSRHKRGFTMVRDDRLPGNALFKKSLRDWQAQWKAQKGAQAPLPQDKYAGRPS